METLALLKETKIWKRLVLTGRRSQNHPMVMNKMQKES
jgi:hypothetical protein